MEQVYRLILVVLSWSQLASPNLVRLGFTLIMDKHDIVLDRSGNSKFIITIYMTMQFHVAILQKP